MTKMLDLALKAMVAELERQSQEYGTHFMHPDTGYHSDEVVDTKLDGYFNLRLAAQAAIKALRDPTDSMKKLVVPPGTPNPVRLYWQMMIDEAARE